jgi:hypothetical protein
MKHTMWSVRCAHLLFFADRHRRLTYCIIRKHSKILTINTNKSMKAQALTWESSGRSPLTSDRSIHLTKLIADRIVHSFLPLSIVESSQFQSILHEAEPSYVIPKRNYFVNTVLKDTYGRVRDKVHQELQQTVGNVRSTHLDLHILCL